MAVKDIFQKIIDFENTFPQDFSENVETDFGFLFFNENNPDSYDCNHALILNYDLDLKESINKIIDFYTERNLIPRIYSSFSGDKEKKELFPLLEKNHFIIEENKSKLYLLEKEPEILPSSRLKIKPVRRMTGEIEHIISQEDCGQWNSRKLKRHIKTKNLDLYIAKNKANRIVAMASVNIQEDIARIDDVLTRAEHRRLGFATELISGIVHLYNKKHKHPLYLFTENPNAEKVYQKAGFVKQDFPHTQWKAYKVDEVAKTSL